MESKKELIIKMEVQYMVSLSLRKYNELVLVFNKLELIQCYELACMGIARTIQLIPYIVKHEEWKELQKMYDFFVNNSEAILKHSRKYKGYDEVVNFFEKTSEIVEDYSYTNCSSNVENSIMGLIYMLFEEWYYFMNLINMDYEKNNISNLVSYFILPIRFLEDYLGNLYYDKYSTESELQKKVENDIIIKEEIDRIEDDLNNLKDNPPFNVLEEQVKKYINLSIIKK